MKKRLLALLLAVAMVVCVLPMLVAADDSFDLSGSGTAEDPYILSSAEDLTKLSASVAAGNKHSGEYFKITADITLPDNWDPIGNLKEGKTYVPSTKSTVQTNQFGGYIDGKKSDTENYLITVPAGSKTLLGSTVGAKLSNLDIYGEKIDGYGVVEYYCNGNTIDIDNVTLKSGTHTKYSGFIGGYASGSNACTITNCTVEKGVVVGDDGSWNEDLSQTYSYPWGPDAQYATYDSMIGSIAGAFNGTISDCESYATVYGRHFVGGIMGFKGQSMGDCYVTNCFFGGEVIAKGEMVGGIVGGGYIATSAPNTPCVTIENCYSTAKVSGENNVGGIFGGEKLSRCNWNNGIGNIRGNYFAGTVSATADDANVGGIIGYMNSLDRYNIVESNYFVDGCGTTLGIGELTGVILLDTNYSEGSGWNKVTFDGKHYGRFDDPAGADSEKLTKAITKSQLTDGSLLTLLNGSLTGSSKWIQGENGPVITGSKHIMKVTSSGKLGTNPEKTFKQDAGYDGFNNSKYSIDIYYSDGTVETIMANDCAISDIDFSTTGYQMCSLTYDGYRYSFGVNVVAGGTAPEDPDFIMVNLSLLGDSVHDVTADSVHTLADGNLQSWISDAKVMVSKDATVLDVLEKAFSQYGIKATVLDSSYGGKYISALTRGTETLSDTSNKQSDGNSYGGWMFNVNDNSVYTTVDQTTVNDGDKILFYFEDDYTLPYVADAIDAINDIPDVLTSENKDTVEDAEASMAWLSPVAMEKVKADNSYSKYLAAQKKLSNVEDFEAAVDKDDISTAKSIFDKLTDEEVALISPDKLSKYKEALKKLDGEKDNAYVIIKGNNSTFQIDSDGNITMTVNGSVDKFKELRIDGKVVDKKNYTVVSGSTVVTLKSGYLDTLAAGKHTITFVYTDGEVSGTFNITEKVANTSDTNNIVFASISTVVTGFCAAYVISKKNKTID